MNGRAEQKSMDFEYCPACRGPLATGWECNDCGRDWMPWAYPKKQRRADKIKKILRWLNPLARGRK
jgi:hypothetical protein